MNFKQKLAVGAGMLIAGQALVRRLRPRYSFAGQSVVITGGSRGLGLVLARRLAAEGAYLTILGRDEASLREAVDELSYEYEATVLAIPCDIGNQCEVATVVDRILDHYGHIDVLINNAGIIQVGPYDHLTFTDFEEAMAVHFWGPVYLASAVLPYMRGQGSGRIVNISSIGGVVAVPHLLPYTASKFALTGFSDGLRAEVAKDGIAVTTVIPGLMRTGSHVNALFKGRHEDEYTWFAIASALPTNSTAADKAARQIIEACRYGDAHLTITIQARLLAIANTLLPNLTGAAIKLAGRFLLPDATGPQGDRIRAGWESASEWAPSRLTEAADRNIDRNNQLDEEELHEYHME
jgi:short-subunit dehydrogenase